MKEQELLTVKLETDALRTTARLLDDDSPPAKKPQRQEVPALDLDDIEWNLDSLSSKALICEESALHNPGGIAELNVRVKISLRSSAREIKSTN